MKLVPLAFTIIAAAFACGASAQNLKPGLWQVQQKVSGNPEMQREVEEMRKKMATLPPEQRKQMEDIMARRGVQMGPSGHSVRMCLTKEMVERNEIPATQGDCKITQQQRTGNTLKAAFTCSNPPSSGQTVVTFTSPEAYTMKTTATGAVGGKTESMTVEGTGKWLGADCGEVRPVTPHGAAK
ncbi:DUF3617 domain-containing protein [Ramlibacter henchirensis]|uniref:DUF3617 domain-containing protein n=1 Tax=Ramlibacter henchirensis TaxID=204072 RepID=A0A4Z0C609_9BURK|nr:DUF3617 domain-containing protein [Ramlibacter henchirensis]TFZ07043.1 DUF3617 domain-containing protein [Ramlibacter henchirensis]